MRGVFKIASVKGINISIHWTFLILVVWVAIANVQAGNNVEQLSWSIFFLLAVFACVAMHELGHASVAGLFGIKARNIMLLPIGGIASIEKFPDNPRQELAISAAGPVVNIIIAIMLWLAEPAGTGFWKVPEGGSSIMHGHDFLFNLRMANMSLALFNLIPAFPMDGGRILRALLGFRFNYIRATEISAATGKVIASVFIAIGILLANLVLPLIGLFIILAAGTEEYYLRLKSLVKGVKLNEVLMYDYDSLQAGMTVKEAANLLMHNHNKYFIVMEGAEPIGSVYRMEILKAVAEMKYDIPVKELARKELHLLDGGNDIDTVLEELARNDENVFPVMEDHHFKGVVNLNHIIEYLLLRNAGTKEYARVKSLAGLLH